MAVFALLVGLVYVSATTSNPDIAFFTFLMIPGAVLGIIYAVTGNWGGLRR